MSDLIVLTFDNEDEAEQVREAIRKEQKQDLVSLDDSAVVVRDQHGKVHVKNELDRGVKIGAVGGGLLGLLITGIFFPFAGILIGVLGGMGVGALANLGVQKSFVKEVSDKLEPGTSAIFLNRPPCQRQRCRGRPKALQGRDLPIHIGYRRRRDAAQGAGQQERLVRFCREVGLRGR